MPKIDVLIPTYNRRKLLGAAIQSVLEQTEQDFHIIVYDDGSADGTEGSLPGDARITYIKGKENRGIGHARRKLVEAAGSEYACWLDSDDLCAGNRLERLLQHMAETGADIVTTHARAFRKGINIICEVDLSILGGEGYKGNVNMASICFRTALGKRFKHHDGLRIRGEDSHWLRMLLRAGAKVSVLPEVLYLIRRGPGRTLHLRKQMEMGHELYPKAYWFGIPGTRDGTNFGDLLTAPIVRALSGVWPIWTKQATNFVVGSVLQRVTRNSVVWGTGLISHTPPKIPGGVKFAAVRGPLTRQSLLDAGVPPSEVPEVYGDPGLLVPQITGITSPEEKTHRLGILPHYTDYAAVKHLEADPAIKVINIDSGVLEVTREAVACESILSSSLHGLVLADSYGIPTAWLRVDSGKRVKGAGFKFRDYLASTGRPLDSGVDMQGTDTRLPEIPYLSPPVIDLDALVQACPFNRLGIQKAEEIQPVDID